MKNKGLKYDKVYILDSMGDNIEDGLIKNVLYHDKKDDENIAKGLSLTNIIGMMLCYYLCRTL